MEIKEAITKAHENNMLLVFEQGNFEYFVCFIQEDENGLYWITARPRHKITKKYYRNEVLVYDSNLNFLDSFCPR